MPSRFKGIETPQVPPVLPAGIDRSDMLSRFKGMETLGCSR